MRTDDLKRWGLTKEQSAKVMEQFGRDVTKLRKENEKLTAERDKEKERAEAAEKNFAEELAKRDFENALKNAIGGYRFTSEAAKKAILEEVREAGLKIIDGKILGLSDLLTQLKEKDPSAFVNEQQGQLEAERARPFTRPLNSGRLSERFS